MSVVEELHCCSIEILKSKEEECYKLSIIKSKSLISFGTFSQADEEKLPHRADLTDRKTEVKTVCAHHKALMIDNYEVLQKNCCNPFKTQKTTIKRNLRDMSLKFAKDQQKNQFA